MSAVGRFFGRALLGILLTFVTLIFEILLAFALYMWLSIAQPTLFASLVQASGTALRWIDDALRAGFPEFTVQAYGTLLGELAPKAVLLLFLGLLASGLIRLIRWIVLGMMRRVGVGAGDGL